MEIISRGYIHTDANKSDHTHCKILKDHLTIYLRRRDLSIEKRIKETDNDNVKRIEKDMSTLKL